ncbi:hypothetical protein MFMK1_000820 [Metallumcola ferriviriculae]|uniref:Uncharacterized protein n=1 Tax=Metallumcola ferriviriculae TaxID=3039180 RepID=A0AAU0ULH7_9FIRM|nr:hypothetical protein MFMK1_000820 [Desulfitibacteraceae bacterium MK1]
MIPLDFLDYGENNSIDMKVTENVNGNLAVIVRVLLDYLNNDPDFGMDGFLPRDYLMRRPQECRCLVDELYELILSPELRYYINPKYEYLLYTILQWWEDCNDNPSELIPNPINKDLFSLISTNPNYLTNDGTNYVLKEIQNYESYYYFCFCDHDFLPSQLSKMLTMFLRNEELFSMFFPDVNLYDYIDLMPVDLRKQYLGKLQLPQSPKTKLEAINIEKGVITELYKVLRKFQKRVVEFRNRGETEISNDIHDSIEEVLKSKYDLQITREFPMGRAIKTLGETDLYIYGDEDYAIIESKHIENFLDQFKQLLGYLNHYFHFGITISINKKYNLQDAIDKIKENLNNFVDDNFKLVSVKDLEQQYVFKSVHIIPEDKAKHMTVYHFILHLNDYDRERIAKEART